jgi:RNA polymerase sigma-70 factor, ECF subfamily
VQTAERVTQIPQDPAPERLADEHRALMARVAADKDRAAFEALFLYFGPRVKSVMLKAGADHAQAEDLMQDVMMTVWRKVDLYTAERGSVGAWIFTIARNARIDRLRRNGSRPYEDVDAIDIASDEPSAEDEIYASQMAERVTVALDELPDEQRKIVELAYLQNIPQSKIAESLSLPLGTVKSRMRLAYAKLRASLEDVT